MKYVFYHGDCLDGFTAAYCMFVHFGEQAEYISIQPGEKVSESLLKRKNEFFFVDYCPDREELLKIQSKVKNVLVLDHHKSSFEKCGDLSFCKFNMNKSGAGIALEYVLSGLKEQPIVESMESHYQRHVYYPGYDQLFELVKFVQDNDLWKFEHPNTKAVNAYLHLQEKTFDNWGRIATELWSSNRYIIVEQGNQLLKQERKIVDHHKARAAETTIFGYENVPVVNISYGNRSLILNELCKDNYFAVGWSYFEGSIKYSLRSKGTFDVEVIATKFGKELGIGGGHKDAASFTSKHFPPYFENEKNWS
jgi:oligoribonuclease NrnB/cAMP/cGMP phosphodiesterase (DHH superfamily)